VLKKGLAEDVADVVLMLDSKFVVVLLLPENTIFPHTSQSPAVKLMLVIFMGVEFVRETPEPVAVMYSPTLPAFALSFVVVPTMPPVLCGVIALVNVSPATVVPNAGFAPVLPTSTWPVVPAAVCPTALVPSPRRTPCDVSVAAPVPPSETGMGVVMPVSDVMLAFAPDVAMVELQPKPDPFVHCRACAAPLQPVTVTDATFAVDPVALPSKVLEPACARFA
jgi:hypothetical protein